MSLILDGTNGLSDIDGSAATPAIRGTDANTGIFFPAADTIAFAEGGAEAMRIDSSGNLGLGVTPSAWYTSGGYKVMQIGPGMSFDSGNDFRARIASNAFVNSGGDFKYVNTGYASNYNQASGQHQWYNAASGTAGNTITFTETMKLAQDGNNTYVNFGCTGLADAVQLYTGFSSTSSYLAIGTKNSGTLAERARITSAGDLGIGTTSPTAKLTLSGNQSFVEKTAAYIGVDVATTSGSGGNFTVKAGAGSGAGNASGNLFLAAGRGGASASSGFIAFGEGQAANTAGLGAEYMRLDSSGNLLVGTTGVPNGTSIYGSGFAPISFGRSRLSMATSSTSSLELVNFFNPNGQVGNISTSGSSTSYATSSDYRLKNTITPMTGALAKVALLKPCTYKWNADGSDGEGFIAHELAEVAPNAVTGEKDAVDEDGKPVYQGIDVSFLVATLTAAIQELKAEFDAYKASHP